MFQRSFDLSSGTEAYSMIGPVNIILAVLRETTNAGQC